MMSSRTLTKGEENLMYDLYAHLILDKKTPGMFREKFEQGARQRRWNCDEIMRLEGMGLVSLSKPLLISAGIICLDLTSRGREYMEVLLAE